MVLDLPAGKIARPIITIDQNSSVLEAAKAMAGSNRGSIIATKGAETVGILTERDILKKVVSKSLDPKSTKVKDVMTSSMVTIEGGRPLRAAVDLMNRKGLRRMLVTEEGKIIGIFTLRDVVRNMRVCTYCGKEIRSILDTMEPEPYMECQCGSRYHRRCAEKVVNCINCSRTLVTNVIYPEPSETFGG